MFEGYDKINPYDYHVTDDNRFVVTHNGLEIHTSRKFRLKSQAERKAKDWIMKESGEKKTGGIDLEVDKIEIDVASIFGLRR